MARLNLFQDGRVADVDYLPGEALDQVLQQRWPLRRYNDGSMWFIEMNFRPKAASRATIHLRRALQLANDPAELVYKVLKTPSYTVAESLFPSTMKGEHGLFRQEYPPPRVTTDLAAARAELELATQELGLDTFPPLVLLTDDTPARDHALGVPAGVLAAATSVSRSASTGRTSGSGSRNKARASSISRSKGGAPTTTTRCRSRICSPRGISTTTAATTTRRSTRRCASRSARSIRARGMRAFAEIQRILIEDAVHLHGLRARRVCTCKTRA